MNVRDIAVCLLSALPPVGSAPEIKTNSRNIQEAIKRLDEEASLLLDEVRGCRSLHTTLNQVAERMR